MVKNGIKNNFILQVIYHFLIMIIPLVLSPYLTRTLGDKALGIYSYVNSIAYYFIIAANLGIAKYGQRLISQTKHDPEELRKSYWSLYTLHVFLSLFVILLYLIISFFIVNEDKNIFIAESIYILSAFFDITWLFYGLENFKSVVISSSITKIIECALIFLLVKSPDDLTIYTIITASAILLSYVYLVIEAFITIKPIRFTKRNIIIHIKPLLVLSISVIAVSLYTMFDKTLLGLMTTKENVAYYEYANKIVALPRTFACIIGTVMFPRACRLVCDNKKDDLQKYIKISLHIVSFIGAASLFGLIAISKQLAILYYGDSFSICGEIMIAMCAIPLIVGLGDTMRSLILIPYKKDKAYTVCLILNTILNISFSFALIPVLGVFGAVVGTCLAELFGCVYQIILCRKIVKITLILKILLPYLIIGGIMLISIELIKLVLESGILSLVLQIILGGCVFIVLTIIYIFLFEKDIWNILIQKLLRRNND